MHQEQHLVFLVEEPSMEAFLRAFLPRILPQTIIFEIHAFQGKADLMVKLEPRLRAHAKSLQAEHGKWRIIVMVDRDDEDCMLLKRKLEESAKNAGLITKSQSKTGIWELANRIVIEELEAWYFGDWEAVQKAYPRVPSNINNKKKYRDSDAIMGGTWETFEQILQRSGYFKSGLPKIEVARTIGLFIDAKRNRSRSFHCFMQAIYEIENNA